MQGEREISDFWIHNGDVDYFLDEVLDKVILQTNFKGKKHLLLKRIRKLGTNQTFSFREKKLLKALIKSQLAHRGINISELSYFFPGKSDHSIQEEISIIQIPSSANP